MKISDLQLNDPMLEGPKTRAAALAAALSTGAIGAGLGTIGAYQLDKLTNPNVATQQIEPRRDEIGDLLKSLKPNDQAPKESRPFVPSDHGKILVDTAKRMGIRDKSDLANFLAQCNVETGGWRKATESFSYSTPEVLYKTFTSRFPNERVAELYINKGQVAIANRALAGKNGNGNEASGDGWRYRGRGFIHLTGRELYAKAGRALHPDNPNIYIDNPDIISSNPAEGAKVAVWYYQTFVGKKKTAAQASQVVNPAGLKHDQRIDLARQYKQMMTQRR